MREPGASVPPELLPEVSAGIRVVCVDDDELLSRPASSPRAERDARRRCPGCRPPWTADSLSGTGSTGSCR